MKASHDELAARRKLRELQTQWQQTLDADAAALDADIVARLATARANALRAAPVSASRRYFLLVPALAAMLVLAVWLPRQLNLPATRTATISATSVAIPDADLELSGLEPWQEDTELLNELDFYTWLEMEAEHAS